MSDINTYAKEWKTMLLVVVQYRLSQVVENILLQYYNHDIICYINSNDIQNSTFSFNYCISIRFMLLLLSEKLAQQGEKVLVSYLQVQLCHKEEVVEESQKNLRIVSLRQPQRLLTRSMILLIADPVTNQGYSV